KTFSEIPISPPDCAILYPMWLCFPVRAGGKPMIKGREELWNLRNVLERLLDFIQEIEAEELPYFYRCFDTMKNNIEIFFCVGCEDIEDLFPVLERDWKASHKVFIGVQYYNV